MTPPRPASHRPPLFRGWYVVWAACTAMTVIFGASYSFAAFFQPWAAEFDAQRADVSWVFGLSSMLYFLLGTVGGMLADRFGPRATGLAGMACLAGGLLLSSFAPSLTAIYLAYGIGVGVGIALVYTPSMGAVQPWFIRQRGLASGIASAGVGAGTLLVPILASWLIAQTDWREAMRWLALLVVVAGCSAAWLLDRDPQRHGLLPDGDPPRHPADGAEGGPPASPSGGSIRPALTANADRARTRATGLSLRETLRTPSFGWLYVSTLAAGFPMFVPFAHLSASARDIGIADARAVALVGLIGIGSLIGRFGIGPLADRIGRLRMRVIVEATLGASFLIWALAGSYPAYAAFAIVFGLSYGGIVSLLPPICSDLYGVRAVSGIIGLLYSGAGFGALLGPVVAGALFDAQGHYGLAMACCVAGSALATFAAWRVLKLAQRSDQGSSPAG